LRSFRHRQGRAKGGRRDGLVAVGRSPYTEGLGLADIGVSMNRRAIAVNSQLETSVDGSMPSETQLRVSCWRMSPLTRGSGGGERPRSLEGSGLHVVPSCVFVQPEIAGVGLTEKQAKEQGMGYKVSKFPFTANSRAQTISETAV